MTSLSFAVRKRGSISLSASVLTRQNLQQTSRIDGEQMARLIQVGNLPESIDSLGLKRLFEPHGTVRIAEVATHHETGRSTGVGCVEMESEKDGKDAIMALNHREFLGQVLTVCWSNLSKNWIQSDQAI